MLHGIEAATYRLLGALPDTKSAMLYSLSAITSYGRANLFLQEQWQLKGALEALERDGTKQFSRTSDKENNI